MDHMNHESLSDTVISHSVVLLLVEHFVQSRIGLAAPPDASVGQGCHTKTPGFF